MTSLSLVAVMQAALFATDAENYADAHRKTTKTGRPMVVLVGADWCPACKTMEKKVIPQVKRRGVLRRVAFAIVNLDRERRLGRQLTRGGPIPQLIMYRRTGSGWKRRTLIGGQSVDKVASFIDEGVKLDAQEKEAAAVQKEPSKPKPTTAKTTPARKVSTGSGQ